MDEVWRRRPARGFWRRPAARSGRITVRDARYVFSVLAAPVAQTSSLSVSVEIVAIRDDFSERGSATRSTLESPHRSNCLAAFLVSGCCGSQTRAPLRLRLRRAALYRRFLNCHLPAASNALPITNRRLARSLPLARSCGPLSRFAGQIPFAASQAAQVGRLKICATVNRYYAWSTRRRGRLRYFVNGPA